LRREIGEYYGSKTYLLTKWLELVHKCATCIAIGNCLEYHRNMPGYIGKLL
jgi:hypothetical protein